MPYNITSFFWSMLADSSCVRGLRHTNPRLWTGFSQLSGFSFPSAAPGLFFFLWVDSEVGTSGDKRNRLYRESFGENRRSKSITTTASRHIPNYQGTQGWGGYRERGREIPRQRQRKTHTHTHTYMCRLTRSYRDRFQTAHPTSITKCTKVLPCAS